MFKLIKNAYYSNFHVKEDLQKLDNCSAYLKYVTTDKEYVKGLKKVYKIMKNVGEKYYLNNKISSNYQLLLDKLEECEERIGDNVYICDVNTDFIMSPNFVKFPYIDYNASNEEILNYIVYATRNDILLNTSDYIQNLDELDLTNFHEYSCYKVKELCDIYNIECEIVNINPGYLIRNDYNYYPNMNSFNLITLRGITYLVDLSYKQFFKLKNNLIERLGVLDTNGCHPGVYMLNDGSRYQTAQELLKNGWIEATQENFKNYLDGFTLSFRNGLAYEKNTKPNYNVAYTTLDYIDFLSTDLSLYDYEDFDTLGLQLKPLKNKYYKF